MSTKPVRDSQPLIFYTPQKRASKVKSPKSTQESKRAATQLKAAMVAKQLDQTSFSNASSSASEDAVYENEEVSAKSKSHASPSANTSHLTPTNAWHSVSSEAKESEKSEETEFNDLRPRASGSGLLDSRIQDVEDSKDDTTLKECQNRMLLKMKLNRVECEYEIARLTMTFQCVKEYKPSPEESYSMPLEVMTKMIARVKELNQSIDEEIDAHFNQNSDYYALAQYIETDFKNYIQTLINYYVQLEGLHKQFSIAKEVTTNLCDQLATYLKKDKKTILELKTFEKKLLLKISSEQRTILNALIRNHIAHQYGLDKIWIEENAATLFLEETSEEPNSCEASRSPSSPVQNGALRNGLRLSFERNLLEALCRKIKQRMQMRRDLPSYTEQNRINMITQWIELIEKAERSLTKEVNS